MSVPSRPIPALYTVYILRSTVRHASLYIGSTTDPPRRLKQHNGEMRGGAVRTSRATLQPWEMVGLVSGFPGTVAALKFEWALTNPHLSLHIPSESRLTVSRRRKRNGRPRRPPHSLQSVLANLHLLLRVPSFVRWPLRLHVFVPEVYTAWQRWCSTAEALPDTLEVTTDFGPQGGNATSAVSADIADHGTTTTNSANAPDPWGIHALPLDYAPLRDYVDKARDIFSFEREGACAVCHGPLPPGKGLYAVCPSTGCEAVGHLRCWGQHLLKCEGGGETAKSGALVPVRGHCPSCSGAVAWGDMMKELTLRQRAPKEVYKLVKVKRQKEKAAEKVQRAEEAAAAKIAKKAAREAKATAAKAAKEAKAAATKAKRATAKKTRTSASPRRSRSPEVIIL